MDLKSVCLYPFIGFIIGSDFSIELFKYRYTDDFFQNMMFGIPIVLKYILILIAVGLILTALAAIYYKIKNEKFVFTEKAEFFMTCFFAMAIGFLLAGVYWGFRLTYDLQSLPDELRQMVNSTDISVLKALMSI